VALVSPELVEDAWAAHCAWQEYAYKRFYFRVPEVSCLQKQIYYQRASYTDSIIMEAKIAFIVQYMELRGWQRIPGSISYAWENWV
jgi:hypothetical protein